MKRIFENCKHVPFSSVSNLVLLDTCFFINFLSRHKEFHIKDKNLKLGTTSFNVEELDFVSHKLNHELKSRLRNFFKKNDLVIVDVPVSPGDRKGERDFVDSVDPNLLAHIRDPSDAVLAAAAVKSHSHIVTKDKRHLFTEKLEGFLKNYDVHVYKDLKQL